MMKEDKRLVCRWRACFFFGDTTLPAGRKCIRTNKSFLSFVIFRSLPPSASSWKNTRGFPLTRAKREKRASHNNNIIIVMASHGLAYDGCNFFRQRLVLSTLSGKRVKIRNIRSKDDNPGLRDFEASFIRLLDKVTNGSRIEINQTGTVLFYQPGLLYGGSIEHDCSLQRSIGYYLEALLMLAPFMKTPLKAILRGITNDPTDPTVDLLKSTALPLMKKFGIDGEGFDLKVMKRGMAPNGGGEVVFTCPVCKTIRPVQFTDSGKIKRIRGVAYSVRVSPQMGNRIVESARAVLNQFIPDIYIHTDHMKGANSGKSPGFGLTLVAETLEGCFLSAELSSTPQGQGDPILPEDLGRNCAKLLLEEVYRGGCVDSSNQSLALLLMTLGQQDVSKLLLGPLSQYTIYDEERNRLRLQAWEQRNQETSQAKELGAGNVPLFGQPYKTNKGDELSNRIQRMLGSYEDVNNPTEPSAVPADFTQSDRGQPNSDRPGKPLVQNLAHHISCQNLPSSSYPFQMMRDIPPSSPNSHGSSLSMPKASLDHQKKVETLSDLREDASSSQERSAQCLDVKQIPFLHSSAPKSAKDTSDSHQESIEPSSTATTVDFSVFNLRQSPADASLHQAGKSSNSLLSQNFPPLSSSKPPSVVMMQKPTAYVRPMDGQDQLFTGSPELKPSPEPHVPLQEIHKAHHAKAIMFPQYLETNANEAVCVEDILKEMTHSWPPLLSAMHILNSDSSPTKEAEQVPSCPGGQKSHHRSPGDPRHLDLQSSKLFSHKEAHSSGVESASSSDSDSSSRSESDAESIVDEPCGLITSNKTELDAAPACGNWQLGNWIRSSQTNSGNETQGGSNVVCEKHARNPPHGSEHLTEEATQSTQQSGNLPEVQPCGESSHESGSSGKHGARKPQKGYVKCEDTLAGKVPPLSDRPMVKTKTEHLNNVSSDSKSKRTFKIAEVQKNESRPEVVQRDALCPSCPHHCSCHISSQTPMLKISSSKANVEIVQQAKTIPKVESVTTHKSCKNSGHVPKSQDICARPAGCLLVKIDLSLLSGVPKGTPGKAGTWKPPKASKKTLPQTMDMDDKTLPRKKQKLEKKRTSSNKDSSVKVEGCATQPDEPQHKMTKKKQVYLQKPPKDSGEDQKGHKGSRVEPHKDAPKSKDSSKNKSSHAKHMHADKQKQSSASRPPKEVVTSRPLLRSEDRQYPVKHYIKEAKRLKHKADAESDKRSKAFNYLDAAMFFVESGIAMEKDPQISMSSYTMFAETVELLKFVLKLKNSADMTAPPSDKDFVALCLKCQSLLQMAMFRHKHKTALKYSKMLTDHFNNPALESSICATKGPNTPSPMVGIPSPACGSGNTVAVPVAVEQVALSYVNITTLFLSAHELWEQADQMAGKGSGLVAELDAVVGPLSLTSSVRSMVHYTQQGVAWLRLDSSKTQMNVH